MAAPPRLEERAPPAASVILPTYERRELVREAVASILAQTFADFELIVVDDGSTDGTGEALHGLDPRLVYLWQENRGVASARNAGIRLARGEIVAFLDSDNRWLPDHLAVVCEMLARHPEAVLASTCPWNTVRGRESPASARMADVLPEALLVPRTGLVSCLGVRRSALLQVGGFDEALRITEAIDLSARLALLGPFCLLARRTIVLGAAGGSLRQEAIRTGASNDALAHSRRHVLAAIEQRPDLQHLLPRARASLRLTDAYGALRAGDREAARLALADACALEPELSRRPYLFTWGLSVVAAGPRESWRLLTAAAAVWPEPRSDTALFLRAKAAILALRIRRPGAALRLLTHRGFLTHPGFAVRTWPDTRRAVSRWRQWRALATGRRG